MAPELDVAELDEEELAYWERLPSYYEPRGRTHIPISVRRAVFERDGFACVFCAATVNLSLDHIHHYSKGGEDTFENLRVLCVPCNRRRGTRS